MSPPRLSVALTDWTADPQRSARLLDAIAGCARIATTGGSVTAVELLLPDRGDVPPGATDRTMPGLDRVVRAGGTGQSPSAVRNALAGDATGDLVVFLERGTYPAPNLLVELARACRDERVGAADARRVPREHAKVYDPVTGDTGYASTGALTVRRAAFEDAGGFDATHFPDLAADVDLSWRIRATDLRVVHAPAAVVATDDPIPCVGAAPDVEAAWVRLLLAHRWGHDEVVDRTLAILVAGSAAQRRVAERFRSARDASALPARIEHADAVAEFVDGHFAHHRWAVDARPDVPAALASDQSHPPRRSDPPGQAKRAPSDHPGAGPAVSVVVRTQGDRRFGLLEVLTCLAAQTCTDFEVVLCVHRAAPDDLLAVGELVASFAPDFATRVRLVTVEDGGRSRPLNAGVEHAVGHHVAFLDDDDLVSTDWIEQFVAGVQIAPTQVIRCTSAVQAVERLGGLATPHRAVGPVVEPYPQDFDLVRHLFWNRTPICSYAMPATAFTTLGLRFAEDLEVCEDWAVLLAAAMSCGVHDTGACTSLYHQWVSGVSSVNTVSASVWATTMRRVRERFDDEPVVLPPGSALEVAALVERDERVDERLADARRRLAREWRTAMYAAAPLPAPGRLPRRSSGARVTAGAGRLWNWMRGSAAPSS